MVADNAAYDPVRLELAGVVVCRAFLIAVPVFIAGKGDLAVRLVALQFVRPVTHVLTARRAVAGHRQGTLSGITGFVIRSVNDPVIGQQVFNVPLAQGVDEYENKLRIVRRRKDAHVIKRRLFYAFVGKERESAIPRRNVGRHIVIQNVEAAFDGIKI